MTEQSPQYLAPAPAKHLTLVYRIESPQQQAELLAQSGWMASSHSDAITERDALQRRVRELEAQLDDIGAGDIEPLRKRQCLHQIVEPALAVSTLDCNGPLCGCPEYGGGHHPLCKHATPKSAEPQQKPVQEPTAQSFTRGMQILQWNRAQEKPPIVIARELWVADELEQFYISGQPVPVPLPLPAPTGIDSPLAVRQPLTNERKEQATISQCQCRRCLRDRNEGTTLGPLFLPAEATQMIVCPVCGDKRCIHAHDHEAPCAKADLHGHNLWVAHHLSRPDTST